MKTSTLFFALALLFIGRAGFSQTLNWASLSPDQRHVTNVHMGFDFGFTYGLGYGYHLKTKMPIVLNAEHAHPVGGRVLDDFKTKVGAQVRVFQRNDFRFTARVQGVFRRYQNDLVRQVNFGSDMAATLGYYRPAWFVAGEFGFDKAIVTHFKHSDLFREDFAQVKDGWYEPALGGNFYFGIQTGLSLGKNDLTLKAGKVIQQDFKTSPTVPAYVQLGYNRRF